MDKEAIVKMRKSKFNAFMWRVFGNFTAKKDMNKVYYNDQKTFAVSRFDKRRIGTAEKIYDIDGKGGVATYIHTSKGPIVKEENRNSVKYYGFVSVNKTLTSDRELIYLSVSKDKESGKITAVRQQKGSDFTPVVGDVGYEYVPDHLPYDTPSIRLEETFNKMENYFNREQEKVADKGRE